MKNKIRYPIMVNGKTKNYIDVVKGASEEEVTKQAKEKLKDHGYRAKDFSMVIFTEGRMINFVAKENNLK